MCFQHSFSNVFVNKKNELGLTSGIDDQSFIGLIMVDPNKLEQYDSKTLDLVTYDIVTLERVLRDKCTTICTFFFMLR